MIEYRDTVADDPVDRNNVASRYQQTIARCDKVQVDLFNLFNSAAVLTYNQTYSPTSTSWLTPTSVLSARVAKIGATFDF